MGNKPKPLSPLQQKLQLLTLEEVQTLYNQITRSVGAKDLELIESRESTRDEFIRERRLVFDRLEKLRGQAAYA